MINSVVIVFVALFGKIGKISDIVRKIISTVLSVCTLLLISTAMSKMIMYIGEYGFTLKRIYTSWFMITLAVMFILCIVAQFRRKFNFARSAFICFLLMLALLVFPDIDDFTVRENAKRGIAEEQTIVNSNEACYNSYNIA